jgi:hypothetical protein
MHECRCRQKGVEDRNRLRQTQSSPLVRHLFVHRQQAVGKLGGNPQQPFLQGPRLGRVAEAKPLDSLAYFSEHQHAEKQLIPKDTVGLHLIVERCRVA